MISLTFFSSDIRRSLAIISTIYLNVAPPLISKFSYFSVFMPIGNGIRHEMLRLSANSLSYCPHVLVGHDGYLWYHDWKIVKSLESWLVGKILIEIVTI